MTSPRWVYALPLLGAAWLIATGIAFHQPVGIVLGVVGAVAGPALVGYARKRAEEPHADASGARRDARRLEPTALPALPASGMFRWVGGCNVPGSLGRANATVPLGVLLASPGSAKIVMRPPFMARVFGAEPHEFRPGENSVAFPARGIFTTGVGLQETGGPPYYFWTTNTRARY